MTDEKFVSLLEKGKTTREICVVSEEKFAEYCKKLEGYEDSANYDFNTKWINVDDVVDCLKELEKKTMIAKVNVKTRAIPFCSKADVVLLSDVVKIIGDVK